MTLRITSLDAADKRTFDHGQMNVTQLEDTAFVRAVFNPGWRWSVDVRPSAGTSTCQVAHTGVVLAGRLHVRMDDGSEGELGPGDAHVVGPGHDAWVVGNDQCVIIDIGPTLPSPK